MKIPRHPCRSSCGFLLFILLCCNSLILSYIYLPQRLFPSHPLKLLFPSPTLKHLFPSPTNATTTPTSRLLPAEYWRHRREHPEAYKSPSCSRVPEAEDIEYAAAFWQHLRLVNGSMYMYSAYWDDRSEEPLVRVLVYTDVGTLPMLYCQLWYSDEAAPYVVPARATYAWRPAWHGPWVNFNEPYILSCNPAFLHHPYRPDAPPAAVSIVSASCENTTNVLNVQNTPSPAQPPSILSPSSVAVCLKWLDFKEDISAEILEWLLLLKYFEVEAVYIYLVRAHENILRVLNHFASMGFVRLTELSHPPCLKGPGGRWQYKRKQRELLDWRKEQLLPLNDCLYRSVGRHSWLAVFDADEVIVPISDLTYPEILARELSVPADALACVNVFYMDAAQKDHKAPPFAKKLAHTWRARRTTYYKDRVKCFHNVRTVVAMHNHFPIVCQADCQYRFLSETSTRLQHYRAKCDEKDGSEACRNVTEDVVREATLEPWRGRLLEDIPRILTTLGIPLQMERT